jgi:predicted membrane-bound spermidine synthase
MVLVFMSGACALAYQAAWFRQMRLVFGASTPATAAVLSVFMAGLGLGGAWFGRRVERDPMPLRLYGLLEVGVALGAAATPMLSQLASSAYIGLGGSQAHGAVVTTVLQLVLAVGVFGGPAFLMGGTLPAAARTIGLVGDAGRRKIALAYALNTLGAVTGTLLATFWMLEHLGARAAVLAAAGVNLAVGAVAIAIAHRVALARPTLELRSTAVGATRADEPSHVRSVVLVVAAFAGFVFFAMELVWYRLLGPLLGGSTFTFGLVLALALLGTGLGGMAFGLAGRRMRATLSLLAFVCALEALALAFPLALGDRLAVLALLLRSFERLGFTGIVAGWTVVAGCVVLPAALVAGFQFPLLLALLGRGGARAGADTGALYAANTFGAIAGSLAAGFGLMPALTAPGLWRLSATLLCAVGLCVLIFGVRTTRSSRHAALAIAALVVTMVMVTCSMGPTAAWRHSGIGAGRQDLSHFTDRNAIESWLRSYRRSLVWSADGRESSVAAVGLDGLGLVVGGKSDGHAINDGGTQVMLGMLPALLHHGPRRALVIGLGTGSTAGWLGMVPGMERVEVAELEPAVAHIARLCAPVNRDVMSNPRVHVIVGDGRDVLRSTRERYDLVASEPSNPYRAGVASLYTVEFYRAARARLAPGGIFVQWVQAYEADLPTLRMVYATMCSVFPSVESWSTLEGDLALVASEAPLQQDTRLLRRRIGQEPFASALRDVWHTNSLEGVAQRFIGDSEFARVMGRGAPLNTDDNMALEYRFARHVGRLSSFTLDDLRGLAQALNAGAPPWSGDDFDERSAATQRIGAYAAQNIEPPHAPAGSPYAERVSMARAFVHGDLVEARRSISGVRDGIYDFTTLAMVAYLLGDAGDEDSERAIGLLREVRPAEAGFCETVLQMRRGNAAGACDAYVRACDALRRDPWTWPLLAKRGLRLGVEIAMVDPTRQLAARVFQALEKPFAAFTCEDARQEVRFQVALRLDGNRPGQTTSRVLAGYADDAIPWDEGTLKARAELYAGRGDLRAANAAADLARLRANRDPSLASLFRLPRERP